MLSGDSGFGLASTDFEKRGESSFAAFLAEARSSLWLICPAMTGKVVMPRANVTMKCLSWIQCNASRSIALPPSSFERAQKTGHFILRDHELILQGSARFHPDSVSNYILLIKLHMCWLISRVGYKAADNHQESFPSYPGEVWAYQTLYDSERAQWEESKTGWLLWDLKMVSHSSRRRGLATCQQLRNQGHISLPWLNLTIPS